MNLKVHPYVFFTKTQGIGFVLPHFNIFFFVFLSITKSEQVILSLSKGGMQCRTGCFFAGGHEMAFYLLGQFRILRRISGESVRHPAHLPKGEGKIKKMWRSGLVKTHLKGEPPRPYSPSEGS